ncbi:MAG: 30S ribosomal protein S17 [Solirubrobacterales bacterium]
MVDEENNVEETTEEVAPPEEAAAPPAEESSSSAEETPAAEDSSADADASSDDSSEEAAEPGEVLSPKEKRKTAKSGKNRRPRYTGTLEERRAQRDVHRKKKAVSRRAHRLKQREEHKAAGPREGTPAVVKEPGRKKIQQGTVVSSKTDKTITIEIEVQESHRIYKKVVRHTKKLTAHDERNDANEGDTVRVMETRPMSKTKRWRLVEVVERAR